MAFESTTYFSFSKFYLLKSFIVFIWMSNYLIYTQHYACIFIICNKQGKLNPCCNRMHKRNGVLGTGILLHLQMQILTWPKGCADLNLPLSKTMISMYVFFRSSSTISWMMNLKFTRHVNYFRSESYVFVFLSFEIFSSYKQQPISSKQKWYIFDIFIDIRSMIIRGPD